MSIINHITSHSTNPNPLSFLHLPTKSEVGSDAIIDKWEGRSPILKAMFDGGTIFDAFMMEAAQLVGQSLLSLPWIFSLMGYASSIFFIFFFSLLSLWTNHLVITMLAQYRYEIKVADDPRSNDVHYVASYHDVIEHFAGRRWSIFTLVVVAVALFGLCIAQIIATASNIFLLQDEANYALSKRSLTLIVGGFFLLVALVPTAREYRPFSMLAVFATFYTACYMTTASIVEGPAEDVQYGEGGLSTGQGFVNFFLGLVAIIFNFGGLSATIEKADVMDDRVRNRYDQGYLGAVLYSYIVTIPIGVAAYHTFGSLCQSAPNSFYLFQPSLARTVGVILMSLHEFVAFGLFANPLFSIIEKAMGTQGCSLFPRRLPMRVLLLGFFVFISVMAPFFGTINGLFAAFTTSFGTYIIPMVGYNIAFSSEAQTNDLQKQHPKWISTISSFKGIRYVNWFFGAAILIFGVGFGGYSSIVTLVEDVDSFSVFPKCYEC